MPLNELLKPGKDSSLEAGADNTDALNTVIGNRTSAAGGTAVIGLEVPVNFADPDATVTQAFSAFAFFSGTPGASQGTLQGGSSEASAYLSGAITQAGLGFEGIAAVGGTGSMPTSIGLQSTAFAQDTATVTDLIGFRASAPFASGGTPTVTNAYSIQAIEPATGTSRYTFHGTGRHRFMEGTHANVIEIVESGGTLQWASDGATLKGYASDGASERIVFDPQDAAAQRLIVSYAGGATKGLVISDVLGTGTGNVIEYLDGGTPKFAVLANGNLYLTESTTTTAPAAGGAGALPATPAGYVTLSINGAACQIPYY